MSRPDSSRFMGRVIVVAVVAWAWIGFVAGWIVARKFGHVCSSPCCQREEVPQNLKGVSGHEE